MKVIRHEPMDWQPAVLVMTPGKPVAEAAREIEALHF
jgi:hypothetical protein